MKGSTFVAAAVACARQANWFALAALLAVLPGVASAISSDLGVTVVTSNPTPTAGGAAFSYTVVVKNTGVNAAFGIKVVDPLPPGVVFQNIAVVNNPSVAGFGLVCTGPPVGTNGVVTCRGVQPGVSGALTSTSTITIVAQIAPNVAAGVRTNTVSVMSDTQEATPNVAPNTASVQQTIQVSAPLGLSILATPSVVARDTILYQVAVANTGSSDALAPTLTLNLPAGTQFLHMHESNALHATCRASGGGTQVICEPASIPSGTHYLVLIAETFLGTPPGLAQATATLTPGNGTVSGSPANAGTSIVTAVLDIDSNGAYDALTDGLILLRSLFGLSGASMISGALGANATRTDPAQISQYLSDVKPYLDVDGDGGTDALTDGLLIIRYLFGLRGPSLLSGAVGTGATRTTPTDIETYIQTLTP